VIPEVPLPAGSKVRQAIDVKLKPGWRWEAGRRVFLSHAGKEFDPRGDLPRNSRIVYKVPSLAERNETGLSKHEKDLRRYAQVILPAGESPAAYLAVVRAWPPVAEAQAAPEVSLPSQA
jgi:hypothetical protein